MFSLHGNLQAWKVGFQSSLKFWKLCSIWPKPILFFFSETFFFTIINVSYCLQTFLQYKALKTLLHVVSFFSFVSCMTGISMRKIWLLITQKSFVPLQKWSSRCHPGHLGWTHRSWCPLSKDSTHWSQVCILCYWNL